MMLQGAPGAGWGFGPRRGVRWGFRPGHGVCGDSGLGAGWGFGLRARGVVGIWAPARGGAGIRARARVGWGFGARARGVVGIQTRGAGRGGFGPGRGVGWGFGPRRGVGIIWGKMGNFLPFCRFSAVWVEICISSRLCMILNITPTQQIRIPVKIIHIVI